MEREPDAALTAAREARAKGSVDPLPLHVESEATRRLGRPADALNLARKALRQFPGHPGLTLEAARSEAATGQLDAAIARMEALARARPDFPPAWRTLAELRERAGDAEGALEAAKHQAASAAQSPELLEAARLIQDGKLGRAEALLRPYVKAHPTDVSGIRLLADVALRLGVFEDSRKLLERALELAPDFHMARHDYANCLIKLQRFEEAETQLDRLERAEPDRPSHAILKALLRVRTGHHQEACEIYARILKDNPDQARIQLSYGHALKTIGQREDAVVDVDVGPGARRVVLEHGDRVRAQGARMGAAGAPCEAAVKEGVGG